MLAVADPVRSRPDSPPARAIAGHVNTDRNEPRGIGPAAAVRIRRLLDLPADADDSEVRAGVATQVRTTDAALALGFSVVFDRAVANGRVDRAHRTFWRDEFYDDPDRTREFLAQTWRQAL